uniref:Farnesyl pyrophosphate synthase n=1 Tax=Nasutitermes takasagoensis TaxID=62960 RepID=A0A4Y1S212_9NEOP|nr:farnesyl diphosphate synthase-3 [Nasutitermes takasagoensis]
MLGTVRKCVVVAQTSLQEVRRNILRTATVIGSCQFTDTKYNGTKLSSTINGSGRPVYQRKLYRPRSHARSLSTLSTPTISLPVSGTVSTKDENQDFMSVFPDIVRDLTETGRHLDIPDATKWFEKLLQYNVSGGKKNRGLTVVYAYRMLAAKEELTPENIRLSQIMGWCVEMLQAHFLVLDDIIDGSVSRRGQPCWYLYKNIGPAAINDGLLLEQSLYQLLRRYFRDKPYYACVLELFHDTTFNTVMGETFDILASHFGKKQVFEKFTMDRYNSIAKYKTAYYSFILPFALSMHMAGIMDEESHRQAKTILLEMGQFYQVQDDYLDCFGDPEVTGKIGTDIEDGKCTWLAVVALQRASPEQKALLADCYGSKDPEKVAAVKELYRQLGFHSTFATYEDETYNIIRTHIQQLSCGLPPKLFLKFMGMLYKRER